MNWWQQHLTKPINRTTPRPPMDPALRPPNYVKPPEVPVPKPAVPEPVQQKRPERETSFCPDCSSTNYMAAPGSTYMRCYDCGFPISQTGSGIFSMGGQTDGTTKQATQVKGGGFNPNTIIGKVE